MGGETGAPEIPYCRSLSLLGERAAGTLYAADSDRYGGPVTVTVYPRPADDRDAGRFEAAVETARRLGAHPHMPTIHASGHTDGGRPYVVSDGHARTTAQGVLATSGVLGVDSALAIGIALAGALETAHRAGVIHRGVAPEVVLLLPDGQPLLAEAGLAEFARPQGASAALSRWIPYHAPPEVLEDTEVSPATDVYSLASVVYSLLVGQPPHPSSGADDSTASLLLRILQMPMPPIERSDVPPGLEDALRAALSHSPAKRPPHALELAWALQEAQRLVGLDVTEPVVLDLTSGGSGGSGAGPGPAPAVGLPPAGGPNGSGGRDWSWLASVPPAAPGGAHRPPAAQPPAALPPAAGNGMGNGAGAPTAGNGTGVFAAPPENGLTGPQAPEGGPENGTRPPLEARRRPTDSGPPNGTGLPLGLPAPEGGAGTAPLAGNPAGNPPAGLDNGTRPPLGVGPGDTGGPENGARPPLEARRRPTDSGPPNGTGLPLGVPAPEGGTATPPLAGSPPAGPDDGRPPLEARNRPGGFDGDGAGREGGTGSSVFAPGGGTPAGGRPAGDAYRTGSDERRVAGGFPAGGAYRGGDNDHRRPAGGSPAGGATGPLAPAGGGGGSPGSPAGGSDGQPVTPWWAGPPNGGDASEARAPGPPDLGPLNRPTIDPTVLAEALARQNRPGSPLPADSPLHQPLPTDERPPIDTRRLEAFEPARPGLPAAVPQARQAPAPAAPPQERRRSEPDAAPATPDDAGSGGRRSRRGERRRQSAGQPADAGPGTAPAGRQPATGIPTAERPAASRAGAATVTDDRAVSALERARQARLERQRREREAGSSPGGSGGSGGDAPAARRPIGATPDMAPKRTGPPALPVLVLVALVVILGLGGAWMVISGTDSADPAPSTSTGEQGATTSTEQGEQEFSPNRASDLTAVETPEGVQLDWEGPVGVDYLVRILSPAEPPRPIGAGPATALLIPATAVQPGGAYCFDVVAAPEDGAPPVSVPDDSNEAVLPTACINGAQPDGVIRP